MKIPRDLGADELIKLLKQHEYAVTRQSGSHIRLTTNKNGEHHITTSYNNTKSSPIKDWHSLRNFIRCCKPF